MTGVVNSVRPWLTSLLSALARLDVDPWQEATSLARMSKEGAAGRLTALIDALPHESAVALPSKTIAADLVALLPTTKKVNVSSPDNVPAVVGARQAQIRLALCALALIVAVILTLSANHSPGSGNGAEPSAPVAADATTVLPRRSGP